jgi:hypothetical protein
MHIGAIFQYCWRIQIEISVPLCDIEHSFSILLLPLYIIKRHVQQVYSVFVPTVTFGFVWCDIFNKELRVEYQTSLFCLMDLHSCTCYCYFTLFYFISHVNMILLKYGLCIK